MNNWIAEDLSSSSPTSAGRRQFSVLDDFLPAPHGEGPGKPGAEDGERDWLRNRVDGFRQGGRAGWRCEGEAVDGLAGRRHVEIVIGEDQAQIFIRREGIAIGQAE